jgi:hypothetical protein
MSTDLLSGKPMRGAAYALLVLLTACQGASGSSGAKPPELETVVSALENGKLRFEVRRLKTEAVKNDSHR